MKLKNSKDFTYINQNFKQIYCKDDRNWQDMKLLRVKLIFNHKITINPVGSLKWIYSPKADEVICNVLHLICALQNVHEAREIHQFSSIWEWHSSHGRWWDITRSNVLFFEAFFVAKRVIHALNSLQIYPQMRNSDVAKCIFYFQCFLHSQSHKIYFCISKTCQPQAYSKK